MSDNESRPGRAAQSPASEGAVMTPGLDATAALAAALAEVFPVTKDDGTLKPPEESAGWAKAIIAALAAQKVKLATIESITAALEATMIGYNTDQRKLWAESIWEWLNG